MVVALEHRDGLLRRSERLVTVGRMAAQVAHEVRNPLMSIGLNTEMLEDELQQTGADADTLGLLKGIQGEVERLVGVTEGYLTLARLPSPEFEGTQVNDLLEDLIRFQRVELELEQIGLELELADSLPEISADGNQLRQAFLNLIRNAAEAMGSGGLLRITTSERAGGVDVSFADTGPGVPEAERETIFEPLYTTKRDGTGIGLAVTRQIVQVHGGAIECDVGVEGGGVFKVHLPALAEV